MKKLVSIGFMSHSHVEPAVPQSGLANECLDAQLIRPKPDILESGNA